MKQIPEDDWTDQDLLTRGEAAARLAEALESANRALDDPDTDAATREVLLQRRQAIESISAQLGTS